MEQQDLVTSLLAELSRAIFAAKERREAAHRQREAADAALRDAINAAERVEMLMAEFQAYKRMASKDAA